MTALAMIIGMAPMALGLGEGGEQNAPLGRAVIGGLIFATVATLMFVPVVFSIVHGRRGSADRLNTINPRSSDRRHPCLITGIFWNTAAKESEDDPHRGGMYRRCDCSHRHCGTRAGAAGPRRPTDDAAIPSVKIIRLADAEASRALVLPGDIEAFYGAPVYARVTGYLKAWYTDIGTPVKKGQLLAEIDAPDLDQQLQQAKGNLGTAIANENIAHITAKRYLALEAENAIAVELVDQQVATWKADQAATASARAIVKQYEADESFKQLVAPFDGIVTSRSTDVGALITAGTSTNTSTSTSTGTVTGSTISTSTSTSAGTSSGAPSPPLFTVSDEHRMRIYVRVPQSYAAQVKPGLTANFTVPQYPGPHIHRYARHHRAGGGCGLRQSAGRIPGRQRRPQPQSRRICAGSLRPAEQARDGCPAVERTHLPRRRNARRHRQPAEPHRDEEGHYRSRSGTDRGSVDRVVAR